MPGLRGPGGEIPRLRPSWPPPRFCQMSPTLAHPKESCCTALSAAHTQNTVPGPLDLPLPHLPAHLHAHSQLHHLPQHPLPTYMPTIAPAPAPAMPRLRLRLAFGVQHTPMRCRPRAPAAPACPCPRSTQHFQRIPESLRHHSFSAFTTIFSIWNSLIDLLSHDHISSAVEIAPASCPPPPPPPMAHSRITVLVGGCEDRTPVATRFKIEHSFVECSI